MNEPGPTIREAMLDDLPAVIRIEQESFPDPWSAESFETSLALDRMRFLVASGAGTGDAGSGEVLAYVIALVLLDEAEIADIAVSSAARCRGIGGRLLDAVMADLIGRGVRTLFLEVRVSNTPARALYESRSFREVGRRRGYYRLPTEDALVLRREIGPT